MHQKASAEQDEADDVVRDPEQYEDEDGAHDVNQGEGEDLVRDEEHGVEHDGEADDDHSLGGHESNERDVLDVAIKPMKPSFVEEIHYFEFFILVQSSGVANRWPVGTAVHDAEVLDGGRRFLDQVFEELERVRISRCGVGKHSDEQNDEQVDDDLHDEKVVD